MNTSVIERVQGFQDLNASLPRRSVYLLPAVRVPVDIDNVWSAAELQAKNENDSWSAPMYSALSGVSDSGP